MRAILVKSTILSAAMACAIFAAPVVTNTSDSVAYASGSSGGSRGGGGASLPATPRASREQREAERLYNQGRKLFRKRLDCDDSDCLVGEDVINRDNATDYLIQLNQDEKYSQALDDDEIRALSVYMIRRYRIQIQ